MKPFADFWRLRESKGDVALLADKLGNPQLSFPTIHVAGTNGKGSVCAKIAHAYSCAGYRVGLYTSPHLISFEERIVVDGEPIPREWAEEKLDELINAGFTLNCFEYLTLLAFDYFRLKQVDIAVIEVMVGGAKDSTNIVEPELSVITSISHDHTKMLGNSIEEIAQEKAGIIKPGVPVVVGPRAALRPIYRRAAELGSPLFLVEQAEGIYEWENRAIARKALELLSLPSSAIEEGLQFRLPCRFEERAGVIFDVAHNPAGFERLIEALEECYRDLHWRFLIGMSEDKDIKQCLKMIAPHASHLHVVQAENGRAAKKEQIAQILADLGDYPFSTEVNIREGFSRAMEGTREGEKLIVCGSFYIMPEILQELNRCRV